MPIDKPDHIAIELGGLANFVRQKVYAFFAQELAGLGLVTVGSSNHIRRLNLNKFAEDDELRRSDGEPWGGIGAGLCSIERIDWQAFRAQ